MNITVGVESRPVRRRRNRQARFVVSTYRDGDGNCAVLHFAVFVVNGKCLPTWLVVSITPKV